jgi:uncharacterized membrane protein YgdD (TMEM256/DUF423 family)
LIALGALNAAIAVGAGAFAAHGLRDRLDARALEVFETAARYQMYHAFAIILAGLVAGFGTIRGAQTAGWMFQAGIGLGAVTPLGGLAFLAGWLWLGWVAWRG